MGIVHRFSSCCKDLKKYSKKNIETSFYTSLILFTEQKKVINQSVAIHILGSRSNFNIINPEHQIEMLRRTTKVCYKISVKTRILFVNTQISTKFDGIIKTLAYRAGQNFVIGRWPSGLLTKRICFKIGGLFLFNVNESYFAIKEANKLGIPVIGISGLNYNVNKIMYPIFCNNLQGDGLFFTAFTLSNSILEGKLFGFIKKSMNYGDIVQW